MEKIDLTKCANCRYKARIDGNEDYGRICVENADTGLVFLRSDREDGYIATWHCDMPSIDGCCGRKVTGFEIVPRDPETYKDWQVGDRVYYPNGDNDIVIFRSGELVVLADDFTEENSDVTAVNTCSQLFDRREGRLVLTDIEEQIIEEKKRYEPQDGDIVAWKDNKKDDGDPAISIFRRENHAYFTLFVNGKTGYSDWSLAMNIIRPATDEEKQLLFDAMSKKGKRWNAEKKVVEDIPKPYEFRKGEPVLVRDYGGFWKIGVLTKMQDSYCKYVVTTDGVDECGYRKCIPYNERTMHLLGTSEDYKEEI